MALIGKTSAKVLFLGGMAVMFGGLGYSCYGVNRLGTMQEAPIVKQMEQLNKREDDLEKKLALCVPTGQGIVSPGCVEYRLKYDSVQSSKAEVQEDYDAHIAEMKNIGESASGGAFRWMIIGLVANIIGMGPYKRYRQAELAEKAQQSKLDDLRG